MKREGKNVFKEAGTNLGVKPSCPHRFISAFPVLSYMIYFLLKHLTTIV